MLTVFLLHRLLKAVLSTEEESALWCGGSLKMCGVEPIHWPCVSLLFVALHMVRLTRERWRG